MHPDLVVHSLEVLLKVVDGVRGADDNLTHRVAADESRKATQRLLTRPTHTHQQRVATVIEHNADNASNLTTWGEGTLTVMVELGVTDH